MLSSTCAIMWNNMIFPVVLFADLFPPISNLKDKGFLQGYKYKGRHRKDGG